MRNAIVAALMAFCACSPVWPAEYDIPEGMIRYPSAKHTQEIAITNNRDRITPVPRTSLEKKWQVPGGLENVTGWTSELYQSTHTRYAGIGTITVTNGGTIRRNDGRGWYDTGIPSTQDLRGWTRRYSDGQTFIDVLRNERTGKIFEVRVAEKQNGRWHRFVDYRDRSQWPAGYRRVAHLDCVECHRQAGSGGYSVGLVPGGDEVISDPYKSLDPWAFK